MMTSDEKCAYKRITHGAISRLMIILNLLNLCLKLKAIIYFCSPKHNNNLIGFPIGILITFQSKFYKEFHILQKVLHNPIGIPSYSYGNSYIAS